MQLNVTTVGGGASFRVLQDGMDVLATGDLPGLRPIHAWTSLRLLFHGQNASAFVDGELVATAVVTGTGGMAGLASGWHIAEFDDFELTSSNVPLKSCDTADLTGIWERLNSTNDTVVYTVQDLNSTYKVSSDDGLNATLVQGDDFVQLSSTRPGVPSLSYGRLRGSQCDTLDWVSPRALDSAPASFVAYPQHRIFGRGYWQISGNFTLTEAEAKCIAEPQCKAITLETPTPPDPESSLAMWLTADTSFFAAQGWQSYVNAAPSDHPAQTPWIRQAATLSPAAPPQPTQLQVAYQARELTQFMHFSVSTFAPVNCSNGTRCVVKEQNCLDATETGSGSGNHTWNESLFNPLGLDTDQWVRTAKEWGAKEICLTAKHSGGFALWPTDALNGTYHYSVKYSPWKDGKGDVIREFTGKITSYDRTFLSETACLWFQTRARDTRSNRASISSLTGTARCCYAVRTQVFCRCLRRIKYAHFDRSLAFAAIFRRTSD